ncbi:MAG: hypothetical protein HY927_16100 [Elusimicrobia bacterium]|nr:hypothetical protein [Elusimicrobiota bacterium]
MIKRHLSDFVKMESSLAVWRETVHLLRLMSGTVDIPFVAKAFKDVKRLFAGRFPGYRACNTMYHDLQHTTDTMLAMARLMHGATAEGVRFTDRELAVGTLAAMMHDTGYIQESADLEGTGAKHTALHVERSVEFMREYFLAKCFPEELTAACESILLCTGLHVDLGSLQFGSSNLETLGKMLGAGDLLGQMADRCYLEKLLFLFYEYEEGRVPGFKDEFDMLAKTIDFHDTAQERLSKELGAVHRFMRPHFKARWGVDRDVYADIMAQHIRYLKDNLEKHKGNYRALFQRGGLVEKLKKASKSAE